MILAKNQKFWYPYYRMKEAGAEVTILGPCLGPEEVHGKHGLPTRMEMRTRDAKAEDFDAVIIPGGYAPDRLRRCPDTLIRDDMINAGADWVDEEVVVDGNMITSRSPADLPAFCRAIIKAVASRE